MPEAAESLKNEDKAHDLSADELRLLVHSQAATITSLQHQLEWFKRQIFGAKSERYAPEPDPQQMHLGEQLAPATSPSEPRKEIPAHSRRTPKRDIENDAEALPFFDEACVPVQTIVLTDRSTEALSPDQFEVIGEKVSYRLAQRPGSYVVLKYVRPVTKRRDTQTIHCPPAPVGVIEGSRADVSFIVGLLIDKFAFHLPLYRQHQRLTDAGITVSRPWLTQIAQNGIALLEPIYAAQLASIRQSRVKAMDETPIKAGRDGHGKMKTTFFWPVYGEHDEVCFPFYPSREGKVVRQALGLKPAPDAVLLSDGYYAYEAYAKKTGLTHAQCWAHSRRNFFEAQSADPQAAHEALEQIQELYAIEEHIREKRLVGESKRLHRLTHSKPRVDAFFEWVRGQCKRQGLTPTHPLTEALDYVHKRRLGLEVFLSDPDVPLDTNHLERALRVIPMGRKSWNFCWTEMGAKHVGIIQSLIVTCRLHEINPYEYLIDVLQRISEHPAARVAELTPRLWKQHFAANPLRSDLDLAI
jgi:transposase